MDSAKQSNSFSLRTTNYEMKIAKEDFPKFLLHLSEIQFSNDIQIRTEDNLIYAIYTIVYDENIHVSDKYKPQLVLFREHFSQNDDSSFLKCLVLCDDNDILGTLRQWFSILPDYFYILVNHGSEEEPDDSTYYSIKMQNIKDMNSWISKMLEEANSQNKKIMDYPDELFS